MKRTRGLLRKASLFPAGVALLVVTVAMAVAILGAAAHPVSSPSNGTAGQADYRGWRDVGMAPGAVMEIASAPVPTPSNGLTIEHDFRGVRDIQSATSK